VTEEVVAGGLVAAEVVVTLVGRAVTAGAVVVTGLVDVGVAEVVDVALELQPIKIKEHNNKTITGINHFLKGFLLFCIFIPDSQSYPVFYTAIGPSA
jgi:hypothetical protein